MRKVTLIVAIVSILAGGGIALVRMGVNFKHADRMKKVADVAEKWTTAGRKKVHKTVGKHQDKKLKKSTEKLKSKVESLRRKYGLIKYGGVMMLACGVLGVFLLVMTFLRFTSLINLSGLALILLSVATIIVNPDYKVSEVSAASARTASYMVTIPIMFGALLAMLSEKIRHRQEEGETG